MKKSQPHKIWLGLLTLLMCLPVGLNALQVSSTVCSFSNYGQSYIELYSKIASSDIQWVSQMDQVEQLYAELEMLCLISKDGQVVLADKYKINSPESKSPKDFWDLKRYGLEAGNYSVELQYVDLNNLNDTLVFNTEINVKSNLDEAFFSDILLLRDVGATDSSLPFNRSDFKYEPLAYNLLDPEKSNLIFYTEVNNSIIAGDELFIKYYLENPEMHGIERYSRTGYKKLTADSLNRILIDFPVSEMVSGNYVLRLELNDKLKNLICEQSTALSIFNPFQDYRMQFENGGDFESSFFQFFTTEELDYSLKAIYPRVGNNMTEILNYIIRSDQTEPKKYFLYSFWSRVAPENMEMHYNAYMEVAKAVDNSYFTNVFHGFETDRGRIFLKYGKPDDLVFEEDEPTAPPYEIWIYNYVPETQQTNVKFLFYNPTLATNDFVLLHSNCRGERNNPRWELDLYSDAVLDQPSNYIDSRSMPDNFNRNAKRYFSDF